MIVEGSVQRQPDQIHITAQLIDVAARGERRR
jgi:TolB-like protein